MTFYIIAVAALIFFSALMSCGETSIVAASRARISRMAQEGNKRAKKLEKMLENREKIIGVMLAGNNIVNIIASVLTTTVLIGAFGENGAIYATAILTIIIIIFAEILPKNLAMRSPNSIALFLAPLLLLVAKILYPVTYVGQKIVDFLVIMIFGKQQKNSNEAELEEIREAVELKHKEGSLVKYDKDLLDGVLDLSDTELGEIMVHRKDIASINADLSIEEILKAALEINYTRIPLWRDDKENIVAVLNVRKLLKLLHEHRLGNDGNIENFQLTNAVSEPWFVPASNSLRAQLFAFRKKRKRFALVVDEYGSLLGLVTLEDILEEIVGEIKEQEDSQINIIKIKSGAYKIAGRTLIRDINKQLDFDLTDDAFAYNLSTFIISALGRIPDEKENFLLGGYYFEILKKKGNDLLLIKVREIRKS
jgi:Mg2+/Co2+ transporter CorB